MINQTLEKLQAMKQAAMVAEYRRQLETGAMNELSFEERLAMIVCIFRQHLNTESGGFEHQNGNT